MQGPDGDDHLPDSVACSITSARRRRLHERLFGEQVGGQRAAPTSLDAVRSSRSQPARAPSSATAGGVVNVITKSGTNPVKGSLFTLPRLEGLTRIRRTALLTDFHREQFGGTSEPIVGDKRSISSRRRRPRKSPAAEPVGVDRHAVFGQCADARQTKRDNSSPDCAARAARALPRTRTGRRAADQTSGEHRDAGGSIRTCRGRTTCRRKP